MEIFTQEGFAFLSRWLHYLSGITWIGLLFYFNFVQVPSFATFEASSRTEAMTKLVPRALWWFRWGAVFTAVSGIFILGFQEQFDSDYFKSTPGTSMLTGMLFGFTMLGNVWGVIWPNQQIGIASAQSVIGGGPADPRAADAARRGFLASRTNTLLSIPMLFFMAATSHFAPSSHFEFFPGGALWLYWVLVLAIWGALEANALGFINGTGPSQSKLPLETVRNVIISGFVVMAVIYVVGWEIILRA
jgi:uncharacterized membrane protein